MERSQRLIQFSSSSQQSNFKNNITASEWENKNFLSGAEQEKEVILSERYNTS
jgi:hypothetical protein